MAMRKAREEMSASVVNYLSQNIPSLEGETIISSKAYPGANAGVIYSIDPKDGKIVVKTVIEAIGGKEDNDLVERYTPKEFIEREGLETATQIAEILEKKLKKKKMSYEEKMLNKP